MSTAARVRQVEQKLAEGGAQFSFAASEIRLLKEDAVEDASRLANDIVTQLKAQLEAAQALAATVETLQGAAMPPSPHADAPSPPSPHADAASRASGVEAEDVSLELLPDEDGSPTEAWRIDYHDGELPRLSKHSVP